MKLVVYMPAYQEAETIGNVIKNIQEVLSRPEITKNFSETEIVVLNNTNNGKDDGTMQISKDAGATVFHIPGESKGVGWVIKNGLDHILSRRPDIAVGIDADGQFDPNDIPRLVQPIVNGQADMVTGTKFSDRKNPPKGISGLKLWGNYRVTDLINFILGSKYTDVSCGYRAYSRNALLRMNIMGDRTYVQEAFIDFHFKGVTIKEVPIEAKYFKERKSRVFRFGGGVFSYAWSSLLIILRALRDYKPLTFFGNISLFFLTMSVIPGGFMTGHYLFTGSFSPYIFLGFIAALLFGVSMVMMVIALLADMLSRMRMNQERILAYQRDNAIR